MSPSLVNQFNFKTRNKAQARSKVDFTNVLHAAFTCSDSKSTKDSDDLTVFLRFWDLHAQKQ